MGLSTVCSLRIPLIYSFLFYFHLVSHEFIINKQGWFPYKRAGLQAFYTFLIEIAETKLVPLTCTLYILLK